MDASGLGACHVLNFTRSARRHLSSWAMALFVLWSSMASLSAQTVPGLVNFQGRLTDSLNNPLSGTHSFVFELYTAPTGGSALWSETQGSVSVSNGVLAVQLGSVTPLDASLFSGATVYLQITADSVVLSPRQRLVTSPYAFLAGRVAASGVAAGALSSSVIASSIAVNAVADASIVSLSASKLTGTVTATQVSASGVQSGALGPQVIASSIAVGAVQDASIASLSALKLTGTISNSALDGSSVTLQGNTFNAANKLVRLDSSGRYPALDGSLITGLSATDSSRVLKAGDTMTGTLALTGAATYLTSQSSISTSGRFFGPLTGNVIGDVTGNLFGTASAVAPGAVDFSTITTALSGKLSIGAAIPIGLIDLSTVTTSLSGKLSSGQAIPAGLVDFSTITTALSGKLSATAAVPAGLIDLSTVTTALGLRLLKAGDTMTGTLALTGAAAYLTSQSSITTSGRFFGPLTGSVIGDLTGTASAVAAGGVDFSTITTALSGKLSIGAAIPIGLIDLSTVTTALSGKLSSGQAIPAGLVDFSTITTTLSGKLSATAAVPAGLIDLSTVTTALGLRLLKAGDTMTGTLALTGAAAYLTSQSSITTSGRFFGPLTGSVIGDLTGTASAVAAGGVDFSTITTALSGKLSIGAAIPIGLIDLSTVTTALSGKLSSGQAIPAGLVDFSTITTALSGKLSSTTAVPSWLIDLSTVTTALSGKLSSGAAIPAGLVDLSTVTTALGLRLLKAGDTMTGTLALTGAATYLTSQSSISTSGRFFGPLTGNVIGDVTGNLFGTASAVAPGAVDLSTITTALSGKLSAAAAVPAGLIDLSTVTTALGLRLLKAGDTMTGDLQVGTAQASTISASGYLTLAQLGSAPAAKGRLYFDATADGALKVSLDGSSFVSLATGTAGAGLSSIASNADQFSGLGTTGNPLALKSSSVTLQGNAFNGADQLLRLRSDGKYPALDGSLISNVTAADSTRVLKAGDTMTGTLALTGAATYLTSQSSISTSGRFFGPLTGNVIGDLTGTASAVAPGGVDLSTITTALSGKLSATAAIPAGLIDLSTVTTALSGKLSATAAVPAGLIDLSTVTTALSGKLSSDTAIPTGLVDLSTVSTALGLRLLKAGDTMTGKLRVTSDGAESTNLGARLDVFQGGNVDPSAFAFRVGYGAADDPSLVVTGSQRVGIGTTAPTQKLDVAGTVKATAFSGDGSALTNVGAAALSGSPTFSTLTVSGSAFSVGGSTLVVTNGNMGLGTTTPGNGLSILREGSDPVLSISAYGAPNTPVFAGRSARGTAASPQASQAGDTLALFNGRGYDGTAFPSQSKVSIDLGASENWSTTAQGTKISFLTTADGGTARSEKMRLTGSGRLGIGTTSPAQLLDVAGTAKATAFEGGSAAFGTGGAAAFSTAGDLTLGAGTLLSASSAVVTGATRIRDTNSAGSYALWVSTSENNRGLIVWGPNSPCPGCVGVGTPSAGGIGTPSSGRNLQVNGTAQVGSSNVSGGASTPLMTQNPNNPAVSGAKARIVSRVGTTSLGIQDMGAIAGLVEDVSTGNGALILESGQAGVLGERARITSAGNMGIGTTAPSQKLEVSGTVKATAFEGDGSGLTNVGAATLSGSPTFSTLTVTGNAFSVGGSTLAVTGGNVGLGTSSPSSLLHLRGSAIVGGIGSAIQSLEALAVEANTNGAEINMISPSNKNGNLVFSRPNAWGKGQITYAHSEDKFYFATNSANQMVIDTSGRVGVGTTAPAQKLEVASQGAADHFGYNTLALTNLHNMNAANGGDHSIGSKILFRGFKDASLSAPQSIYSLGVDVFGDSTSSVQKNNFFLRDEYASGTPVRLLIDASGNVGLGTTAPTQKLDVAGTVKATAFSGDGSALTNLVLAGSPTFSTATITGNAFSVGASTLAVAGGRVGIGTTAPSEQLEVAANVKVGGGLIVSGSVSAPTFKAPSAGSNVTLMTDALLGAQAGSINVAAGDTGNTDSTGYGGSVAIKAGTSPNFSGQVSSITIAGSGKASSPLFGDIRIGAGLLDGGSTNGAGSVTIAAGSFADTRAQGGSIVVKGAHGLSVNQPGNGGEIEINSGSGGTTNPIGTGGSIIINTGGGSLGSGSISLRINGSERISVAGSGPVMGGKLRVVPDAATDFALFVSSQDSTGVFVVNKLGNAGIGTTAPAQKLDVAGTVKATAFQGDGSGLTNVTASGSPTFSTLTVTGSAFSVGSSTFVVKDAKVGIGIASPTQPLDILVDDAATNSVAGALKLSHRTTGTAGNGIGTGIQFCTEKSNGSELCEVSINVSDKDVANGRQEMTFNTGANGTTQPAMRINWNGAVNIGGTDLALAKFRVDGDIAGDIYRDTTGGEYILDLGNAGKSLAVAGSVGIGTTAPSHKLEVASQGAADHFGYNTLALTNLHNMNAANGGDHSIGSKILFRGFKDASLSAPQSIYSLGVDVFGDSTSSVQKNNFFLRDEYASGTPVRLLIDASGNVGLGTTAPTQKLDVAGTVKATAFSGDGSALTNLILAGSPTFSTLTVTGSAFSVGGSTLVVSGGLVGIGTTAPVARLQVNAGNDGIEFDPAVAASQGRVLFYNRAGSSFNTGSYDALAHVFRTSGSDKMRLSSSGGLSLGSGFVAADPGAGSMIMSGSVGIGTSAPVHPLQVQANSQGVAGTFVGNGSLVGVALNLTTTDMSKTASVVFSSGTTLPDQALGVLEFKPDQNRFRLGGIGGTGLYVRTDNNRVGIGTNQPSTDLDVIGTIRADNFQGNGSGLTGIGAAQLSGSPTFSTVTVAGNAFSVGASTLVAVGGSVGIGTSAPTAKLQVDGADGANSTDYLAKIINQDVTAGQGSGLLVQAGNNASDVILRAIPRAGGTAGLAVAGDGSVGMGTISPFHKLHIKAFNSPSYSSPLVFIENEQSVNGNGQGLRIAAGVGTSDFPLQIEDRNNAVLMVVRGDGRIGMGTTAPAQKLDVAGTVKATVFQGDGSLLTAISAAQISGSPTFSTATVAGSAFSVGGSTLVVSGGLVGIGTTAPAQPLDILAAGSLSSQIRLSDVATDAATKNAKILARHYSNSQADFLPLQFVSNATDNIVRLGGSSGSFNSATMISLYTAANATTVSGTERLRIDGSGSVGIGTTAPGARLDVQETESAGAYSLRTGTATTAYHLVVSTGGRVGIGTTAPTDKLHVQDGTVEIRDSANSTNWQLQVVNSNASFDQALVRAEYTGTNASANYRLFSGVGASPIAERFFVKGDGAAYFAGRVGIGTTAPLGELDIINGDGETALRLKTTDAGGGNDAGAIAVLENDAAKKLILEMFSSNQAAGTFGQTAVNASILVTESDNVGPLMIGHGRSGANAPVHFGSSGTIRMTITHGGSVGIGTTAPSQALQVAGTVKATAFEGDGSGLTNVGLSGAPTFSTVTVTGNAFSVGASTFVVSNGNVGIGLTNPAKSLTIQGGGNSVRIEGGTGLQKGIEFTESGTSVGGIQIIGTAQGVSGRDGLTEVIGKGGIAFRDTQVGERMRITGGPGAGSVGIGTTNPSQRLHISGGGLRISTATAEGSPALFVDGGSGRVGLGTDSPDSGTVMEVRTPDGNTNGILTSGPGASIAFQDRANSSTAWLWYSSGDVARLRLGGVSDMLGLNGLGRFGVGTTAPTARLHVSSAGAVSTDTLLQVSSGTASDQQLLIVKGDGRVGIGTTNPGASQKKFTGQYTLDVNGGILGAYFIGIHGTEDYASASNALIEGWAEYNSAGNRTAVGTINITRTSTADGSYDGEMAFLTRKTGASQAEAMRIDKDGKVGIGLTAPTQKLDVAGTVKAAAFQGDGSALTGISAAQLAGSPTFSTVTVTGNAFSVGTSTLAVVGGMVGVGTTNPQSQMHLVGLGGAQLNLIGRFGGNYFIQSSSGGLVLESWATTSSPNPNTYLRSSRGSGTGKVYINDVGNDVLIAGGGGLVGIGTNTPAARLDVNGAAQFGSGVNKSTFSASGDLTMAAGQPVIFSDSSNRVFGSGTDLHIQGNDNIVFRTDNDVIRATITASGNLEVSGSVTATAFNSNSFSVGGSTLVVTGGLVGIGTTSPTRELSFGAASSAITLDTTDGSDNKRLQLAGGAQPNWDRGAYVNLYGNEFSGDLGTLGLYGGAVAGAGNGQIKLFTSGLQRLAVDNAGALGVGLTDFSGAGLLVVKATDTTANHPALIVKGAADDLLRVEDDTSGMVLIGTNTTGSSTGGLFVEYAGSLGITSTRKGGPSGTSGGSFIGRILQDPTAASNRLGVFAFGAVSIPNGSAASISGYSEEAWSSTAKGAYIDFRTTPPGTTTLQQRMIIRGDGSVGIGTSAPGGRLEVLETDSAKSYSLLVGSAATAYHLVVSTGGNVGIGTTSPGSGYQLEVNGVSQADQFHTTYLNSSSGGLDMRIGTGGDDAQIYVKAAGNTPGAGSIGIGTTNPTVKLDVVGTVKATAFQGDGSALTNIGLGSSPTFSTATVTGSAFSVGGSTLVVTGGNVGVGTTNPSSMLEIAGGQLFVGDGTRRFQAYGSASQNVVYAGAWSNHDLALTANNAEGLRLTPAGRVGIGTTSPSDKLHVEGGAIRATGLPNTFGVDGAIVSWNSAAGSAHFGAGRAGGGSSTIAFRTLDSGIGTDKMVITGAGNVGVGIDTPGARLDVLESLAANSFSLRVGTAATAYHLVVSTGGRVGVGTTAPARTLDVQSPLPTGRLLATNPANGVSFQFENGSGTSSIGREPSIGGGILTGSAGNATVLTTGGNANPMQFGTNDTVRMTIAAGGNVGIGTTSPGAKLDVSGSSGFQVDTSNSGYVSLKVNGVEVARILP